MGRAGRRSRDSLAVLIADNFGVDQHYVKHPEEVFTKVLLALRSCVLSFLDTFLKPAEPLFVDLENRVILEAHLQVYILAPSLLHDRLTLFQCAAEEMPINVDEDQTYFGSLLKSICETRLKGDADGWYRYQFLFHSHIPPL